MISILIVDDVNIIRVGTKRLLDDVDGFQVIATADSGESAMTMVNHLNPDVVLMDINMPGMGGIEATKRLRRSHPDLPVIILTVLDNPPTQNFLLSAGASGYLNKDCSLEEMVDTIKAVANRSSFGILPAKSKGTPIDGLSKREFQVFQMLVDGQKTKDISEGLSLSPKTVSTYRTRVLNKLQVSNDAELVRLAMEYGIIK